MKTENSPEGEKYENKGQTRRTAGVMGEVYLPKDAFQVFNLWHNPHRHVCWLHMVGQGNVLHLLYIFINNTLTFSFISLCLKWFRNKTVACKFICNSSIRIVYTSLIAIKPLISWFCARPFLPLLLLWFVILTHIPIYFLHAADAPFIVIECHLFIITIINVYEYSCCRHLWHRTGVKLHCCCNSVPPHHISI